MDNPIKRFILVAVILFSYGVIVTGGSITFRGDTQTFEGSGIMNNLRNITLDNESLLIVDQETGLIITYFNVPNDELPNASSIISTNRSTGFRGDVNNQDNVNQFSRFSETNFNNGTNASAGFIGINDIGNRISMGIASSNFEFDGTPTANIGAIRLGSPANMFFINDFIQGWLWISDLNDTGGFQDPFTAMDLEPNGNLSVRGNLTINNSIAFEQVDSSEAIAGTVKMFCKDTNQCFITRDDGTERRLLDGGGGSILIDDVWNYVVEPIFEAGINVSNSSNITLYGGDIKGVNNLYLTGSVTMGASLGYTGSCINTVYAGGLAVACND